MHAQKNIPKIPTLNNAKEKSNNYLCMFQLAEVHLFLSDWQNTKQTLCCSTSQQAHTYILYTHACTLYKKNNQVNPEFQTRGFSKPSKNSQQRSFLPLLLCDQPKSNSQQYDLDPPEYRSQLPSSGSCEACIDLYSVDEHLHFTAAVLPQCLHHQTLLRYKIPNSK